MAGVGPLTGADAMYSITRRTSYAVLVWLRTHRRIANRPRSRVDDTIPKPASAREATTLAFQ